MEKKSCKSLILTLTGLVMVFGFKYLPAPLGLEQLDMQVIGIFLGCIFLWIFVSTSWPSLLAIAACIMSPLFTTAKGLSASMGSWVMSFVLFSSMCTYAMNQTGFLKRCAVWFITRPIAKKSPWLFFALFFGGSLVMGSFMSPLPTFIVFAAIAEQIFEELGYKRGDRFPQMVILCILSISSLSTATTPIAHSVPVLGFSLLEKDTGAALNFASYTVYGVVISIVIFAAILLIMRFLYKPDLGRIRNIDVTFLTKEVTKMSAQEKWSVAIFMFVILLWMVPGVVKAFAPTNEMAVYWAGLGAAIPPLLGAVLLCIICVDGKPIMSMTDALKSAPWVAVLMVAGTMILGSALTHEDVHVTTWLASMLAPVVQDFPPMLFVLAVSLFVTIITAFASDTVTVTVSYTFLMPLVLSGVVQGVNPTALTAVIGAGACLAIAVPPASGHAAVAVGTGWVRNDILFKYGMLFAIVEGLVLAFVGYPIAAALM